MTYRNRVTPRGEIVEIPLRGAWTGNRGCLHRGTEIVRNHASDLWIICALEFRGNRSVLWRPNRFSWLFFQDEAVALAAGHRPCAECRRDSYNAYRDAWASATRGPKPSARAMNQRLHGERIVRGTHRRRLHELPWEGLPDGTYVRTEDAHRLLLGDELVEWTQDGYGRRSERPRKGTAQVITPPASVAALRAGYPVQIDESARCR